MNPKKGILGVTSPCELHGLAQSKLLYFECFYGVYWAQTALINLFKLLIRTFILEKLIVVFCWI